MRRGIDLDGVYDSSSSWGDYDGDGDLDLVVTGYDANRDEVTRVYRNDGTGGFTDVGANLAGVAIGSGDWADYDGDGDLDLVISGDHGQSGEIAVIYRNDGGVFTDIRAGLDGLVLGSSHWGDYDDDGDPDLVITGLEDGSNPSATIYRNDGGGTFTDIGASLDGVVFSSSDWGDYDGDGDLDLIITGSDFVNHASTVYRNDNGTFTDIGAGLEGASNGSARWGDYDNDGDLDLAITGRNNNSSYLAMIYRNDNGSFTDIGAGLAAVRGSTVDWGDFDGDNDLDLLVSGYDVNEQRTARIYRNENGSFVDINAGVTGTSRGSSQWGDYDADGDLDLVLTGLNDVSGGPSVSVYVNRTIQNLPNRTPSFGRDTGESVVMGGASTTRFIEAGDIDGDPLTLQLVQGAGVGTFTDYGNGIASLVVSPTKAEAGRSYTFSIEATDNDGATTTKTFTIDVPSTFAIQSTSVDGAAIGSSRWGDYDRDGDLDLVVTGRNSNWDRSVTIYRNDDGAFTDINAGLTPVAYGSGSWGDYDGDGDLDLIVTGLLADDVNTATATLYRNDGNDTFTDIGAGITGGSESSDWGDYDGDGDLDLLLTGWDGDGNLASTIYRNDNGSFTDIGAGLTGVYSGAGRWGDYDRDGDLDVILIGETSGSDEIATLYRNDSGVFTEAAAGLVGVSLGSISWGDYDRDGDIDLAINGRTADYKASTIIYRNDNGSFVDIGADFRGVVGSCKWGDYDADGDLDLFVIGDSGAKADAAMYRNDDGNFRRVDMGFTAVELNAVDWADMDADGDPDLVAMGIDPGTGPTTHIYENLNAPGAPSQSAISIVDGPGLLSAGNTGIKLDFAAQTATSSAHVTVARFETPPAGIEGMPDEENVSDYRIVIATEPGMSIGSGTTVRFDLSQFRGVTDPSDITAYSRPGTGSGAFRALPTTVESNGATTELVAEVNHFSEFVFSSPSNPLPVELSDLTAIVDDGNVLVQWQTAGETNNAGFVVERRAIGPSVQASAWTNVGFVDGRGSTVESHRYRFVDTNLPYQADRMEYRLRQMDTDGTATLSAVVSVDRAAGRELRNPFPNPVHSVATLRYTVPEGENMRLVLYDILGRQVRVIASGRGTGRTEQQLTVSGLASGTYFLRLEAGGQMMTRTVTVTR